MKKLISSLFILIFCISFVSVTDYINISADSVFVMAVDWQKQSNGDYIAYFTIDLNYGGAADPTKVHQSKIVTTYNWTNWWADYYNFGSDAIMTPYYNRAGAMISFPRVNYYSEIPDISEGSVSDYECQNFGTCSPSVAYNRDSFYGIPFFIKYAEFICDASDISKGHLVMTPKGDERELVTLIRPLYEGLPTPFLEYGSTTVPLGFITWPGQVARYSNIPVTCKGLSGITKSKFNIVLRPNPIYRQVNPNIAGSDRWQYSSIISQMPALYNSQEMPFGLDITFDYSGQYWNATLNETQVASYYQTLFPSVDMDCFLIDNFGYRTPIKETELSSSEAGVINSGKKSSEGYEVECQYAPDQGVKNLNAQSSTDILTAISIQQQQEIVLQKDLITKKLALKKFMSDSIIPFFAVIVVFIFYIFSLVALGVTILGLLPLMYNQFIKGLKEAFNLDDIIKIKRK